MILFFTILLAILSSFFNLKNKPKYDSCAFNNLCTAKYERLDIEWSLKDIPLISSEEMSRFIEIGKKLGVKNVQWSGLTKKEESSNGDSKKLKG